MARVLTIIHRIEDGVLALLLTGMILLASGQILLRNLLEAGFVWADPITRVMVLWVGLVGALAASREDKQIAIDVLSRFLAPRPRAAAKALTSLFTAGVCGIIAYHAARFVALEREVGVTAFAGLPSWTLELVIPFSFGLMALRYLLFTARHGRAAFAPGGVT
jgi:TRAP-type C4-dicarboxylate transport system permease small subunit